MMQEKLIEILEEILEEDDLTLAFELDEENWDSLNIISFIAALNTNFQLVIEAEKISEATSVGELISLVEQG